jgi:tyrosine kinase 3
LQVAYGCPLLAYRLTLTVDLFLQAIDGTLRGFIIQVCLQVAYGCALLAYRLPLLAYRLPLLAYRLPLLAYRLPLLDYRLPLLDYRLTLVVNLVVKKIQLPIVEKNILPYDGIAEGIVEGCYPNNVTRLHILHL